VAKKKQAAGVSDCEAGGEEQTPMGIRVKRDDVVEFVGWICGSSADLLVFIVDFSGASQPLISQVILGRAQATLPRLTPGLYTVLWSYTIAAEQWQTRTEVLVEGVNRYRQRKSTTSKHPVTRGFLNIEVLP
jgi:hypothetical protein